MPDPRMSADMLRQEFMLLRNEISNVFGTASSAHRKVMDLEKSFDEFVQITNDRLDDIDQYLDELRGWK